MYFIFIYAGKNMWTGIIIILYLMKKKEDFCLILIFYYFSLTLLYIWTRRRSRMFMDFIFCILFFVFAVEQMD